MFFQSLGIKSQDKAIMNWNIVQKLVFQSYCNVDKISADCFIAFFQCVFHRTNLGDYFSNTHFSFITFGSVVQVFWYRAVSV